MATLLAPSLAQATCIKKFVSEIGCKSNVSRSSIKYSSIRSFHRGTHKTAMNCSSNISYNVTSVGGRSRFAAAGIELAPPPIDNDLHEIMREMGAEFSKDGVPTTFGNDEEAVTAATTSVAVFDMSHFGRIRVAGDDRIRFLHNQSTANFQALQEGQGCDTVLVTATARTIDLATAWIMSTAVVLTVSPSKRRDIVAMLDRYIFFADKVEVSDITDKTYQVAVIGPGSDELMQGLGLGDIVGKPYGSHAHYSVEGSAVTVGVGSGVAEKGYTLLLSTDSAGSVWSALLQQGAVPMGQAAWESLRILQGRPAPGHELTDEFNPLEAGLWRAISTSKGCYMGQETIARLITYNGVKQQLWGVQLEGPLPAGAALPAAITVDGQKAGKLTSVTSGGPGGGHFGLGYVKRQLAEAGLQVEIDGSLKGTLVEAPYPLRGFVE